MPEAVGVLGTGQMGAGIAQMAAQAGAVTYLYDPDPAALERGRARIEEGLAKLESRGKIDAQAKADALGRLRPIGAIADLAPCGVVIEAAPERLDLKLALFTEVAAAVADDCILATNTSSLSITEIAAGVPGPERVVGLHFFNPAPVMRLAEVVAGLETGDAAHATARAGGEAMGQTVIDAADIAGFLVNRVNRPFFLEALRILQERLATPEQIDRILRLGGGFRMGPFELMDLIGIETNHAVAESFLRQTYGEPRYQPSPLAARMVAGGRLGRKTGAGWYPYGEDAPAKTPDPETGEPGGGDGRPLVILGGTRLASELRSAAAAAGWAVTAEADGAGEAPYLTVDASDEPGDGGRGAGPRAVLLSRGALHLVAPEAAGFHVVPPLESTRLIETTRTILSDPDAVTRLRELVVSLGKHPEPVADGPGLVLGRILAVVVNEAAVLVGEGNGTAEDVDTGMELGLNYPAGPVKLADRIGLDHVLGLLDGLADDRREPRYRAAPLVRYRAAIGGSLRG
jgi:3-hydroxybutyryl-CoA dehydrogenase